MILDAGARFLVDRRDLHRARIAPDPHAPAAHPLADGEVRLHVEEFALTANNVTYAAFGDAMQYWQFFPTEDAVWGCVPVWGHAAVVESRAAGVDVGRRVYGFLPMGTHLVVRPERVSALGFVDASPHRQSLPAPYNRLAFAADHPSPDAEALQALLRPLFMTAFLIDDFLAENADFGAARLLLSSASSKTACATAFCLGRRAGAPRVVGLTSPSNAGFARALGCYADVVHYADVGRLDPAVPTVYIDFAGDAALRRTVHVHLGNALAYSCAVGGTHWTALGAAAGLPGPRPTLFFAPARAQQRSAPPPAGWGAAGLQQRIDAAWNAFAQTVSDGERPWMRVVRARDAAAVEAAWLTLLDGRADPGVGTMLAL